MGFDPVPCEKVVKYPPTITSLSGWTATELIKGIEGIQRFLSRVYRFVQRNAQPNHPDWRKAVPSELAAPERAIQRKLHKTIKRVSDDFQGRWHFNTCIAAIMELVNELYGFEENASAHGSVSLLADVQRKLVVMLAPFAPYLAHELWETLGEDGNLLKAAWPKFDPELTKEDEIEIPVQISGKLRSVVVVPVDATEDQIKAAALADEKVARAVEGKQIVKVIVVAGKLINMVVR